MMVWRELAESPALARCGDPSLSLHFRGGVRYRVLGAARKDARSLANQSPLRTILM
jgi:hypothetical protein